MKPVQYRIDYMLWSVNSPLTVISVTAKFLCSALCEDENEVIPLDEISLTRLANQIIWRTGNAEMV